MNSLLLHNLAISVDFLAGHISSVIVNGIERLAHPSPLFRLRLRDHNGRAICFDTYDAHTCHPTEDGAIYTNFKRSDTELCLDSLSVRVFLADENGEAAWRVSVDPSTEDYFVEWIDFPMVTLPHLSENNPLGTGGEILHPYNEGALISDWSAREETAFAYRSPEYPSKGSYAIFPNMICSQLIAYLWKDAGLYIGVHDPKRGVKGIDFFDDGHGITIQIRLFCGVDFGQSYTMDFPVVWSAVDGSWESAAERYRSWLEAALPQKAKKIQENDALPQWYEENPLIVAYPVRGIYDHDDMMPNRMYPYTNALPKLDNIREKTQSRLMALLMHWEGTAPWAPPYVWPPFGDVENFQTFLSELRGKGDLMGVYCSGFGYSIQSCMIPEYNKQEEYDQRELWRGMCAGADGKVSISNICTMQRSGYDICPASPVGKELLWEAYRPLFESDLDYVQILDQNHGGGQYFCYSREHGHPPAPGTWMTEQMQELLTQWNEAAPNTLFGCESAAAEPFIGNLLFSDNRYELNYMIGRPVPLYAYLYHEYLRNFMGNQVSCPLHEQEDENLWYRIAYSFSIGDCMTLVIDQDGQIKSRWGKLKTNYVPDQEKVLRLVRNLTRFYREKGKSYLYAGRMIPPAPVFCDTVEFPRRDKDRSVRLPQILTSAWIGSDSSRAQILVNPTEQEISCICNAQSIIVPPMDAVLMPL